MGGLASKLKSVFLVGALSASVQCLPPAQEPLQPLSPQDATKTWFLVVKYDQQSANFRRLVRRGIEEETRQMGLQDRFVIIREELLPYTIAADTAAAFSQLRNERLHGDDVKSDTLTILAKAGMFENDQKVTVYTDPCTPEEKVRTYTEKRHTHGWHLPNGILLGIPTYRSMVTMPRDIGTIVGHEIGHVTLPSTEHPVGKSIISAPVNLDRPYASSPYPPVLLERRIEELEGTPYIHKTESLSRCAPKPSNAASIYLDQGNEAFWRGEYANAVFQYGLALSSPDSRIAEEATRSFRFLHRVIIKEPLALSLVPKKGYFTTASSLVNPAEHINSRFILSQSYDDTADHANRRQSEAIPGSDFRASGASEHAGSAPYRPR